MDKATPDSAPANVEGVMAIAFELARIREEHGAQSGMYLSEVRALRAEVERLATQSAPTEAHALLTKVYELMLSGEISLTNGAGGGSWALPDQIDAYLNPNSKGA